MSSALKTVVAQIQEDRRRLKKLINGGDDETVELEGRTEKTIANSVKSRLDSLTVGLDDAVKMTEENASKTAEWAKECQSHAESLKNVTDEVEEAKQEVEKGSSSVLSMRNETERFMDETMVMRDEVLDCKKDLSSVYDQVKSDASLARKSKEKSEAIKKDVMKMKDEMTKDRIIYPISASLSIDPSESKAFRVKREKNPKLKVEPIPDGRFAEVMVLVEGTEGEVTWPEDVCWDEDPVLGENWTLVSLTFFSSKVIAHIVCKG